MAFRFDDDNEWHYDAFRSTKRRAGLRGGATGAIAPGPPLQGGPRDEIYLFQIKYSFEKFSWFRSDTRIQLYYIPMFY